MTLRGTGGEIATLGGGIDATGQVLIENLSRLIIGADVESTSSVQVSNVSTAIELGADVDVRAGSTIDLANLVNQITLTGGVGTTNNIITTGNSILLASVQSTFASLSVSSRGNVSSSSITLGNGNLTVIVDSDGNSTSSFVVSGPISAQSFTITGNGANDSIAIGDVTTIGNFQMNTVGEITLAGNVRTSGGGILFDGTKLLVDGTALRRIESGFNNFFGGSIDLSLLDSIDGVNGAANLEIDSRGTFSGANVSLAPVVDDQSGLQRLDIQTSGFFDGGVTLRGIQLVAKAGVPPTLSINQGDSTPPLILAEGTIDLSSSSAGVGGGFIHLGSSVLAPLTPSSSISLLTSNTNNNSSPDGSRGGDVILGGIGANGINYFNAATIDARAADPNDLSGTITFLGGLNRAIDVDGSSGANPNTIGILLAGNVVHAQNGTLFLRTNPLQVAGLNSSGIDLRSFRLSNAMALNLDTAGGGQSGIAGNIFLGDVGQATRPTSLTVDTRGATDGKLILDDQDSLNPTVLRADGNIDLTNAITELRDHAELHAFGPGVAIRLGEVTTNGNWNLSIQSDFEASSGAIQLQNGDLEILWDQNGDDLSATFTSSGTLSARNVTLRGTGGEIATLGGGIDATGQVLIENLSRLIIDADVESTSSVQVSNVSTAIELGSDVDVRAGGTIDLANLVNQITLNGISSTRNEFIVTGNTSMVRLARLQATNLNVDVSIASDFSAELQGVHVLDGDLLIEFAKNTTNANPTFSVQSIVAGKLDVVGGTSSTDSASFHQQINTGFGGVDIRDVSKVVIEGNIFSDGQLAVTNASDRIEIHDFVNLLASGVMDLQTNVQRIDLLGATGTPNSFVVQGNHFSMQLADISSPLGVNLSLISDGDVLLKEVDLSTLGALFVQVDANDLGANRLEAESLRAGSIQAQGSFALNDTASITGLVQARIGSVSMQFWDQLEWGGDVLSANSISVQNVRSRIRIAEDRLIEAQNGDIDLALNVARIDFAGGLNHRLDLIATNGQIRLSPLHDIVGDSTIQLRADLDVLLESIDVDATVEIVAGDHGSISGIIQSNQVLKAKSLSLLSATGFGITGTILVQTPTLSVNNRISGDLHIVNTSALDVDITQFIAGGGGNILYEQSGGGDVLFSRVLTLPSLAPVAGASNIELRNDNGDLTIDGLGVQAGGEGNIRMETLGNGNLHLDAIIDAAGNQILGIAAGSILGAGELIAHTVILIASGDIGSALPIELRASVLHALTQRGDIAISNQSSSGLRLASVQTLGSGAVDIVHQGGGDLVIDQVVTGPLNGIDPSDIQIVNRAGRMTVQGLVRAGSAGSIDLNAAGDVVLGPTSAIVTRGVATTIDILSGGIFSLLPGAVIHVGSSDAATDSLITRVPPQFLSQSLLNSIGVNVDNDGNASLAVQLLSALPGVLDRNFALTIDWGDGSVDRFPNGVISPRTTLPAIPTLDASGTFAVFTHQYEGNPNVADPTAPIPVVLRVDADALNRVQIIDSRSDTSLLSQTASLKFVVPESGLFTVKIELPTLPEVQKRFVFSRDEIQIAPVTDTSTSRTTESPTFSVISPVEVTKKFVLRVLRPSGSDGQLDESESIPLEETDVNDITQLFQRLGDNRYRVYVVFGENEVMLRDFYLRNHLPVDIEEETGFDSREENDSPVLDTSPEKVMQITE